MRTCEILAELKTRFEVDKNPQMASMVHWIESNGSRTKYYSKYYKKNKARIDRAFRKRIIRQSNEVVKQRKTATFKGETLKLSEWAEKLAINEATLYARLFVRKWSVEKAFTTPSMDKFRNGLCRKS